MISQLSKSIRQYMLVTFNYWNFTVTDGALRMLVVLYFHDLGYSTLAIASLFLFYEFFGVVTNLIGGWLGARLGLNKTMNIGLAMQVFALLMLAVPNAWLTIPWVMAAQALSGIAKDLNKMSAKSAIKTLVPDEQQGALYKWVAILTGSKNALKGAGFFVGGLLLSWLSRRDFRSARRSDTARDPDDVARRRHGSHGCGRAFRDVSGRDLETPWHPDQCRADQPGKTWTGEVVQA